MSISALIVSPDPTRCERIGQTLIDLGCVTMPEVCRNIDEAETLIRNHRFNGHYYRLLLIECSRRLPDGSDLSDIAKALDPRTLRCLMVDQLDADVADRAESTHAHHHLALPPSVHELQPIIQSLLNRESSTTTYQRQTSAAYRRKKSHAEYDTGSYQRQPSQSDHEDEAPFFGAVHHAPRTRTFGLRGTAAYEDAMNAQPSSSDTHSIPKLDPDPDTPYPTIELPSPSSEPTIEPPTSTAAPSLPVATPLGPPEDEQDEPEPPAANQPQAAEDDDDDVDPFEASITANGGETPRPTTRQHRPRTRVIEGTQRIRRSVTGSLSREQEKEKLDEQAQSIGSDPRYVRCAHCKKGLRVAIRERSYTTPCVHCGVMNTIPGNESL